MKIQEISQTSYSHDFDLYNGVQKKVCNDNFINTVLSPYLSWVEKENFILKLLDRGTGAFSFLKYLKKEACQGKITKESANLLFKAVLKTGINTAVFAGGVTLMALTFSFGNLPGMFLVGIGMLFLHFHAVPKLVDFGVDKISGFVSSLSKQIRSYIESRY
ncbi:MAG: hypothetical protein NZT61_06560 [Deltaproteobacteria bacterium]|nr:hypothetical protein [Deltaproteobacteria bacterium]